MKTTPKKKSDKPDSTTAEDQSSQQASTSPSEAAETSPSETADVERLEAMMEKLSDDDMTGVFFGGC